MNIRVFDIFPLSIMQDKITISSKEKKVITNFILDSKEKTKDIHKRKGDSWLGDTKGYEFLFKDPIMKNIEVSVSEKIKKYTSMLNLDNSKLSFFYQRSWATITKNKERIQPHSHDQSNISFAYYLLKPKNTGDIRFISEPQNEIAKGMFHKEKLDLGLLQKIDHRNTPNVDLKVEEDDIVIFPSKTKHATTPNLTEQTRISISGDVTIMLKDSYGHERLMPHFENWQQF